jgi:hypothetical protein
LERDLAGRIDLHVRKPRRDIKKIPCLRRRVKLSLLTPTNIGRAAEDIDDRVLLSMMMDSCAASGFDEEKPSPNR